MRGVLMWLWLLLWVVQELASVGSILTVLCVVVLSILFPPLFQAFVDGLHVPDWAQNSC